MCLPFSIFRQSQTPSWKYDLVELILGFLGRLGMVVKWLIMAKADGAYRQGVLAASVSFAQTVDESVFRSKW